MEAVASVGTRPLGNNPFTNVGSPICVSESVDQNNNAILSFLFKLANTVFDIVYTPLDIYTFAHFKCAK